MAFSLAGPGTSTHQAAQACPCLLGRDEQASQPRPSASSLVHVLRSSHARAHTPVRLHPCLHPSLAVAARDTGAPCCLLLLPSASFTAGPGMNRSRRPGVKQRHQGAPSRQIGHLHLEAIAALGQPEARRRTSSSSLMGRPPLIHDSSS